MPDETERNYHIGYAKAFLVSLFDDLDDALATSWTPGNSVVRYNRRWFLTRILDRTDDLYFGRIGFVVDDEVSTLKFDPRLQDFIYGEAPSGYVVPFVIRKSDGVVAYQLYPGVVRETTFTGALTALLNEAQHTHVWSIESFGEDRTYQEWLSQTRSVTGFDVTLERPNPNYLGRPRIEEMVEGLNVESLKLAGKAIAGEAINLGDDLFRQALDHVVARNYGKAKLRGEDFNGIETVWQKIHGWVGRVAVRRTFREFGPEVVPESVLVAALTSAPSDGEIVEPSADGDEA